ncbi:uncharacterized protein LOC141908648 [Tubulanus polymorphus]|uniref:uncharacterized protein LOC141908648 n=1 Tax=Tubulanus polymorphus TaxID=672921 RepID=UPI003DA5E5A6
MECRKSQRVRKLKRAFSPDLQTDKKQPENKSQTQKTGGARELNTTAGDKLPNGDLFSCEICRSNRIYDPRVKKCSQRQTLGKSGKYHHLPRHVRNKDTGKIMIVCHACGLSRNQQLQKKRNVSKVSYSKEQINRAKESYLRESKLFAENLYHQTGNVDCRQLYCPHMITVNGCSCLQNYINIGNPAERNLRVHNLLTLVRRARDLRDIKNTVGKPTNQRGLGSGRKKTDEYANFVVTNRRIIRDGLDICEKACQRILLYSNNFLHKKLVTEQSSSRLEKIHGTEQQGQKLISLDEIPKQRCCGGNCTRMAITHVELLKEWRERAQRNQHDARVVLAEMLTPAAGCQFNCYEFIRMVTGCSSSTISRVNSRMLETGGRRQSEEHGLKKYWRHQKLMKQTEQQRETESEAAVYSQNEGSPVAATSHNHQMKQQADQAPLVLTLPQDSSAKSYFVLHQPGQPPSLIAVPNNILSSNSCITVDASRSEDVSVSTSLPSVSLPTVQSVFHKSSSAFSEQNLIKTPITNQAATRTIRSASLPSNLTLDRPRQLQKSSGNMDSECQSRRPIEQVDLTAKNSTIVQPEFNSGQFQTTLNLGVCHQGNNEHRTSDQMNEVLLPQNVATIT